MISTVLVVGAGQVRRVTVPTDARSVNIPVPEPGTVPPRFGVATFEPTGLRSVQALGNLPIFTPGGVVTNAVLLLAGPGDRPYEWPVWADEPADVPQLVTWRTEARTVPLSATRAMALLEPAR